MTACDFQDKPRKNLSGSRRVPCFLKPCLKPCSSIKFFETVLLNSLYLKLGFWILNNIVWHLFLNWLLLKPFVGLRDPRRMIFRKRKKKEEELGKKGNQKTRIKRERKLKREKSKTFTDVRQVNSIICISPRTSKARPEVHGFMDIRIWLPWIREI